MSFNFSRRLASFPRSAWESRRAAELLRLLECIHGTLRVPNGDIDRDGDNTPERVCNPFPEALVFPRERGGFRNVFNAGVAVASGFIQVKEGSPTHLAIRDAERPGLRSHAERGNDAMTGLLAQTIRAIIAGSVAMGAGVSPAYAELPVPLTPVTLSKTPVDIATQGQATAAIAGHAMTIKQLSDKTTLDWQRFNIGAGNSVRFEQPSSSSVALNNIHQADPSRILGTLTANGQVYLVNQNGFVFGKDSQVNVNALVATTLGISDTVFQNGITQAFDLDGSAALQGSGEVYLKDNNGAYLLDGQGQKIKIQILLENGAGIRSNAPGGRVILAAPVIDNAGDISTPDGQTILAAAKDKVYLQEAGADSGIRGLLVEVGSGGAVNNVGKVLAERGNASLLGFAVNQRGLVSATTSVSLNGSVRLLAREGIQDPSGSGGKLLPAATVRAEALDDGLGGKAGVHLAGGSLTQVGLDADKTATAIDAQTQNRSHVEISGHDVTVQAGATIQAQSGNIDIAAVDDPTDPGIKGDARVVLEAGSRIDAAGVKNLSLPVQRNVVQVELRANELRDAPAQRGGVLYGQTVAVDLREAKLAYDADSGALTSAGIPVADIKGAVDRIARNIDERSTSGGTVTLKSSGDVVTQSGSVIDISGGSIAYRSGTIATTQLVADGQVFDIAHADPNRHYDAILGQAQETHPHWGITENWTIPGLALQRFEPGYLEGKAGGTLHIAAYQAWLDGAVDGGTVAGPLQRTADSRAAGSTWVLDLNNNNLLGKQDVVFRQNPHPSPFPAEGDWSEGSAETAPLTIDAGWFKRSGISHVELKTNGSVSLLSGARLELPDNGSLNLAAAGFDIQGAIVAPSGTVTLQPVSAADTRLPSPITLGATTLIDVAGRWVNDLLGSQQGNAELWSAAAERSGDAALDFAAMRFPTGPQSWIDSQPALVQQTSSATKAIAPSRYRLPAHSIADHGGEVTLVTEQGDLQLDQGSRIDVSGGAWLDVDARLHAGQAGAIQLTAATHDGGGAPSSLILDGALAGWGLTQGGSLSLDTSAVVISETPPANSVGYAVRTFDDGERYAQRTLQLTPDFFRQGGFADYRLTSNRYGLTLADNTALTLRQQNLQLSGAAAQQAGGVRLLDFSTPVTLPDAVRNPVNLQLSLSQLLAQDREQSLTIGLSALIQTDADGAVQLDSDTSIQVDGTIVAPGGNITLNINTPSAGDKGYFATQGIQLGAASRLLAPGAFKPTLNEAGLKTGEVLSGGNVTLTARRGYIVSSPGSLIDVSGTAASLDIQYSAAAGLPVVRQQIVSSGGNITLRAGEGMLAEGSLLAKGGDGAAGGALSVELNRNLRNKPLIPLSDGLFPDDVDAALPRSIVISDTDSHPASSPSSGMAWFNSAQLNDAGFDSLRFKTDVLGADGTYAGNIQFKGNVQLSAPRQIVLDTPQLKTAGGIIGLHTDYAALGSSGSRIDTDLGDGSFSSTLAPAPKTGSGSFSVSAQGIDLIGGLSFNGFDKVHLNSQGDVRTIGIRVRSDTKDYLGQLKLAGDLTIQASQVYPATLSDYRINLSGDQATLTLSNSGAAPSPVYSAAGKLTLSAADIQQSGVLKAPFGTLVLDAARQLTLAPGSLTSVSGAGLTVLFGQGSGGMNWLYPLDSTGNTNLAIDHPPEKHISLTGKNIALQDGAKVELSGGGDLYAYEFIAGPGGSVDVLDPSAAGYTPKYAVLPTLNHALTPYDPKEFAAAGLQVGDSVYLSSGSALAAGWYTLLPAHYALLPGAYLLTPQADSRDRLPGQASTDLLGATLIAGRYGAAGTATGDGRWQGFAVEPGAVARTRAQYTDYLANRFFAEQAAAGGGVSARALPQDAGSLALSAQTGLTLGAELAAAPAGGGLGGQVDISATHLAIIGRREDDEAAAGTVYLPADALNQLNAPSLLLGGVRSQSANGRRVTVAAQTLTIAGNAALRGAEILLAAQNTLKLESGALVSSTGKNGGGGVDLQVANQGQNSGDGVLLRVSASGQADIDRVGRVTGKTGTLIVESGARLASDNSMLLDATQNTVFDGAIDMRGGSLALRAGKISLGDAPKGTTGLVLSSAHFDLDELQLSSTGNLDIYGNVAVDAGLLAVDAAAIDGHGNADATLTAEVLRLGYSGDGTRSSFPSSSLETRTGKLRLPEPDPELGNQRNFRFQTQGLSTLEQRFMFLQPGGLPAISRGLSGATPPVTDIDMKPTTLEGSQRATERESLRPLQGRMDQTTIPSGGVAGAQPPANSLEPSGFPRFRSFPSSSLGTRTGKLWLPEFEQTGNRSFPDRVPKPELGNQRNQLLLHADQIQLASGDYAITGFGQVDLRATTAIKGLGQTLDPLTGQASLAAAGNLSVAGDLHLQAGHYTGAAGATTRIDAGEHAVTITSPGSADPAWSSGLGASLSISGASIAGSGRFDLPSGRLELTATQGDVALNSGTHIDVSGRALTFAELTRYAPAGSVSLAAPRGNVDLAAGAGIDLSSAASDALPFGDAGLLKISAPQGRFLWNGTITALGGVAGDSADSGVMPRGEETGGKDMAENNLFDGATPPQGQFQLDVDNFGAGGFSALNRKLAAAGFSAALTLQQRSGDIAITADDTVTAHQLVLRADQGGVTIDGGIDASGARAGEVSIHGGNGITLGATGKIAANATAAGADGGSVMLDAVPGSAAILAASWGRGHLGRSAGGTPALPGLDLSHTGTVIDVSGGQGGAGGSVHLRAGRDDAQHSVAVTDINTRIVGAAPERTVLEAVRVYDGQSVIDADAIAAWQSDTSRFMATAISPANASGAAIPLLPGLEIRGNADLTLASRWDLLSWRYNDAEGAATLPGFLTLRANGDLNVKATLSDAFATALIPGQTSTQLQDLLQPGRSWSYQLIAGGDLTLAHSYSAPDPFGYGQKVDSQVMVRTGTGAIALQAGGDIQFAGNRYDPNAAAAVYTMGRPADYTRGQLLSGAVPGVPARLDGETDAAYLNRLDPAQMNTLLRYGYFNETLLGLAFSVAEYPTQGGAVKLTAGGNITGIATGQEISDWQVRSGVIDVNFRPTAWGINVSGDRSGAVNNISAKGLRYFNQNVGALGGGDVTVTAGGDVRDLSVMLPTSGKPFGTLSEAANQWTQNHTLVDGGGDLRVAAGNDIVGGEYYVGLGSGELRAGGSIGKSANGLGALLELGDARFTLTARQDVVVGSAFNPTVLRQSSVLPLGAGGDSRFFTYGANSAVALNAVAGNVVLQNDVDAIRMAKNIDTSLASGFEYAVYPGTLQAAAYSGDIRIDRSLTLFPSAAGELSLLANRNIGADSDAAQLININMSDADPAFLPGVNTPAQQLEGSLSDGLIRTRERLDPSTPDATLIHAAVPLHGNPWERGRPARPAAKMAATPGSGQDARAPRGVTTKPTIIAKLGDIAFSSSAEVTFFLPQAAEFRAGRDVVNLSLSGQNLSVDDVTRITAGRDISFDALIDGDGIVQANDKQIELGGPGQLQIQAGRNVSLGGSAGINSIGNTKNLALPDQGGAGIDLLVGSTQPPDYAGFIDQYFTLGSDYLDRLSFSDDHGVDRLAGLAPAQKLAWLQQLPAEGQQKFLLDALFNEIKLASAHAAAAPEAERKAFYQQGFDAIAALFPNLTPPLPAGEGWGEGIQTLDSYQGDLSLVFSQIKTLAGGAIHLAVPGGAVNVGLAGKVGGIQKGADQLGIVAQQAGDVAAFSRDDFNVNQSRVFTMGGGDIAIWSSQGNIDAGKGAKSAISAPAPITSVDAKGNIVTIFPPIVSGSGIQTINPQDKTRRQGNVYLAAPVGIVDAGEAGISGGRIVIAATAVVGASNISASGGSVGVPAAVAPPVVPGGAAAAATSAAKSAMQSGEDDEKKAQSGEAKKATVSLLSADVVGYGDCSVADVREEKPGCGG
ncbi:MAG: filamentous hemagglutinin N-terminal domain-containing protein [Methylococcaceae bacterium]|nr:MAG: filamentous hemagglutinin N-terminal domain-containing protein [Methylococcaceae bacterium]